MESIYIYMMTVQASQEALLMGLVPVLNSSLLVVIGILLFNLLVLLT